MMYAASVLAQTVDILRLLCRSKLSLLKRREVERLNCFVPLKKKKKGKALCRLSRSQQHSEREGIDLSFTVSQQLLTVVEYLKGVFIRRTHQN